MCKVWIIGGTTEGRLLAEYCHHRRVGAFVSVVSEYGSSLLGESEYLTVVESRMDQAGMEDFIIRNEITSVFDASHPYASLVSEYAAMACERLGTPYRRILRESALEGTAKATWAGSTREAAEYINQRKGKVFLATGSKELPEFALVENFRERLYIRVLPEEGIIRQCRELGLSGNHVIAMQGPFSQAINREMFLHTKAEILVTKEAGKAGGFQEKIEAARECGMEIVIIRRPGIETGHSLEQAEEIIDRMADRWVYLIGMGMGGIGQLTIEAAAAIEGCQAILASPRILKDISSLTAGKITAPLYLPDQVMGWMGENLGVASMGILFSGDTGFFSGCKKMVEALKEMEHCQVKVLPGISSLSYLCSSLGVSWEDAAVMSLHGRDGDLEGLLSDHDKIFLLTAGGESVNGLCHRLIKAGYGKISMWVGERLSYEDETVSWGTPLSLWEKTFDPLCCVLLIKKGGETDEG